MVLVVDDDDVGDNDEFRVNKQHSFGLVLEQQSLAVHTRFGDAAVSGSSCSGNLSSLADFWVSLLPECFCSF